MRDLERARRAAVGAFAALLVVAVAAAVVGGGGPVTPAAAEGPALGPRWERGMNATAYVTDGFSGDRARDALSAMAEAGTTHAVLVPVWYQPTATASAMTPEPGKSPSDEGLVAAARVARSLGMAVVVKPHVDVLDGTFRGDIAPTDVDGWFAAYRAMLLSYARIAAQVDAETLVVGTELVRLGGEEERWRALVGEVRGVFDGTLTYAANWVQDAERIAWWDALDVIGVDAYMPLLDVAPTARPERGVLVRAWRPWIDRLDRLRAREGGLPVVFTELGYPGRANAAASPFREDPASPVDPQAQADLYAAALEAWRAVPWFRGIWWWDWSLDGRDGEPGDGSYRPRGAPAEDVLRRAAGTVPYGRRADADDR